MTVSRPSTLRIVLATFGILSLELALIRWTSQQVRVFAYFNNLTLIAAFLGMGLGLALGERRPSLRHWTLPLLLILSAILGMSEKLRLVYLRFPDVSLVLWGGEQSTTGFRRFLLSVLIVLALFMLILTVFICAGTIVGDLFTKFPPLRAYSADLIGSLIGVLAMTLVAALGTKPAVWLALAAAPFLYFSRRALSVLSFIGIIIFGWYSAGAAQYSPYYRVEVTRANELPGRPVRVAVNRDNFQLIHDLSTERITQDRQLSESDRLRLIAFDAVYGLPFRMTANRRRALIVGGGTGNDAAAALRNHFREVVSVEIDPLIFDIGRKQHPERPYEDPRTHAIVNDARAYFEQNSRQRFDVVSFGFLDSHAMFSSMSSLRLETYVYTVDSIRSAWRLVEPGGVLAVTFAAYPGEWISDRLYATVLEATGVQPVIVPVPVHFGKMYIVGKDVSPVILSQRIPFPKGQPTPEAQYIRVPTDDWPFLYIRPNTFPTGYIVVIGGLLLIGLFGALAVFGKEIATTRFDPPLFLMGAAFLLIETRSVVELSLLLGSTWFVNSAVFAGILVMAFLANLFVTWRQPKMLTPFFAALIASLLLNYLVRPAALLNLGLTARATLGGLLNALPVFFAGVIFSALFSRSEHPSASFGSNLLGAVVGGCLEYLSMFIGLKALVMVALCLYLVVLLLVQQRAQRAMALRVSE